MTPDGPAAPEGLIPQIAASGVFVDPTAGMAPTDNSDLAAVVTANFDRLVAPYRLMRDLGVRFINGSDAGVGPGKPHESRRVSVWHRRPQGFVRPAMDADLLVVHGDPAADITVLRAVRAVFRSGEQVTRTRRSVSVA